MLCGPALVAAVVFSNILFNRFVFDDQWTLDRLPQFTGVSPWFFLQSGRGVTYLVHLLDQWLWGSWEPGFHLTNIVLHSLASSLAAYAAYVLVRSARAALLCGLAFAVHPAHVEVVAMFSYRKDILAMIFVLLALIWWLEPRRPWLCYLASLSSFGLGLLSKEVAAVGIIPVLFLADLLPGHQHPAQWTRRLRRGVWRILPIVVLGIIATTAFAGNLLNYFTPHSVQYTTGLNSYGEVLTNSACSATDFWRLLVFPLRLSPDYALYRDVRFSYVQATQGVLITFLWLVFWGSLARRAPMMTFAAIWPVVTYLPCANIVPITHFLIAERFLYTPSFGICLLFALLFESLVNTTGRINMRLGRLTLLISALPIFLAGWRSYERNRDWQNDVTLWSATIRDGGLNLRSITFLGVALTKSGRFEEALRHYERALRWAPDHAVFRWEVARALMELGRLDEAAGHCRVMLAKDPANRPTETLLREITRRMENNEKDATP